MKWLKKDKNLKNFKTFSELALKASTMRSIADNIEKDRPMDERIQRKLQSWESVDDLTDNKRQYLIAAIEEEEKRHENFTNQLMNLHNRCKYHINMFETLDNKENKKYENTNEHCTILLNSCNNEIEVMR